MSSGDIDERPIDEDFGLNGNSAHEYSTGPNQTAARAKALRLRTDERGQLRVWSMLVTTACCLVAGGVVVTLVGWVGGEPALQAPIPGFGPMHWTTGLSLLSLSAATLLRKASQPGRNREMLADTFCMAALTIASVSLFRSVIADWPWIQSCLAAFSALRASIAGAGAGSVAPPSIPWRMSLASSVSIALLAIALLTLDRLRKFSTVLLSFGMMLALAALCGFLYQARELFGAKFLETISIQAAISMLLLNGAAFATRPLREPMRSLFAPELGVEARMELLVGTWALPLILGMAVRDGYLRGWYAVQFELGLFVVAVIGLQTLLIWRSDYALTHLTQGKQKMEAVLRKNEKLAVAGRLAASISHEINNPLESISNLLYLIRTSSDPREQHTYADLAAEELRRVSQITTQTLSFYRENMSPKLAPMTPILESSVQLLRGKISTLGVKLTEEYREPLPAVVCSSGELRQVLVNLISNALDATTRGGRITIRASVSKAWTRRDRSVVRIAVADNGCGMPPAVLAKVFEPFYTTKEKTGNGLGLWVAADLIEKHGGWMKVRSRTWGSRRGTTFELVLPVGGGDGEG